jgi:glycosyltransferase involved in cell wall biosynthesis
MWYPRAVSTQARLHNALYLGPTYRALLRGVDAVHVSNENDERLFPERLGWPADRLFRVPYPYSAPAAADSSAEARHDGRLRVLFAGRLTDQKGIDVLMSVLRKGIESRGTSGMRFTVAGSGDPQVEREMNDLASANDDVAFLGHVPRDRMSELYANSDVAIVPSNWETFPFACLEPQAVGVPVVASDIPGCRDIVLDGESGFLIPAGDSDALWSTLARIRHLQVHEPRTLAAMGDSAREHVAASFAPDRIMDSLEQMFADVASGGRGTT